MIFLGGSMPSLVRMSRWAVVSSVRCRNVPAGPSNVPTCSSCRSSRSRFQVPPVVVSTIRTRSRASQQRMTWARIRSSSRWCPVGFQKSAWPCDLQGSAARHDRGHGFTPALPDLQSTSRLAHTAQPGIGIQEPRTARPTSRGRVLRRTNAKPRLDWANRGLFAHSSNAYPRRCAVTAWSPRPESCAGTAAW